MRVAALLVVACALGPAAHAAVIRVPADHPTIQMGIGAALTGDTVLVAPGTYYEHISTMGKSITLISAEGAAATVIDGQGNGVVVSCLLGETSATVIDGFTVTHGGTSGIECARSSPTFRNLRVVGNSCGQSGGGAYCAWAQPTFLDCFFGSNTTTIPGGSGGGLLAYSSSPVITRCEFTSNSPSAVAARNGSVIELRGCGLSGAGGASGGRASGVAVNGGRLTMVGCEVLDFDTHAAVQLIGAVATIDSCVFSGNTTGQALGACLGVYDCDLHMSHCTFEDNSSGQGGAACYLGDSSSVEMASCVFRDNHTPLRGGAVWVVSSSVRLVDCWFVDATADFENGAVWCESASLYAERCLFATCSAYYSGGAIGIHNSDADIRTSTFFGCSCTGNPAGGAIGMTGASDVSISACIVAFSASSGIYAEFTSFPIVSYCDVFSCQGGLYSGAIPNLTGYYGNISADPLFCSAGDENFTLDATSPCAGTAPGGGNIGAFGVGCGAVAVQPTTWGRIKAMFR